MTNAELLAKIKAEIERRIKTQEYWVGKTFPGTELAFVVKEELKQLLSFLDTLESEKPIEELEKEIQEYLESKGVGYGGWIDGWKDEDLREIARHFFNLGLNARKI